MHVFRKNELIEVFQTILAHWLDLVATLGSYLPSTLGRLGQFQPILIIFERYVMDNTAQLGIYGEYRLGRVPQHSYSKGLT